MNYFEIFKFEEKFNIDLDLLEQKYLDFQKNFHPDKAGIKEVENSILVNEAYKILSDDFLRLAYILKLNEIDILDDAKAPKVDFDTLSRILELQEAISSCNELSKLDEIKTKLQSEIKLQIKACVKLIDSKDFALAAQILIKAKYLKKSLSDLKEQKKKIK